MQFECHVTLTRPQDGPNRAFDINKILGIAYDLGPWKSSEIARDPVLGEDTYFYLTAHSDNLVDMYAMMGKLTGALRTNDIKVIREKIEMTIYDSKGSLR